MTWLTLLIACSGDPTDGDSGDTGTTARVYSFAELQRQILVPRCGGAGCHGAASAAGDLVLEGDDAYRAVTEDPCANEDAHAAGLPRVYPGAPEESFFYLKVTQPEGMGDVMPPWGAMTSSEVSEIFLWIQGGAAP